MPLKGFCLYFALLGLMQTTTSVVVLIVCTHIDKAHIHNHIIWNSTALDGKRKYRDFHRSAFAVRKLSDQICAEHNLSVIEKPGGKSKPYNIWLGEEPKLSHREQLRLSIDSALSKQPESFEDLLSMLEETGCEIKRRKNPSIRISPDHRFARFDTLGPGYSAEELSEIIAGTKKAPQRKKERSEKPKAVSEAYRASFCRGVPANDWKPIQARE